MSGDRERLLTIVANFRRRRVAVLGDLVADEFVYGDIARVSREAPVLILEHRQVVAVPGGGGNAVANLRALGAMPLPVGILGRDESGGRLAEHFGRMGVATRGLLRWHGWSTPTKSRVLAGGVHTRRQQIVRIDRGAPHGELPSRIGSRITARLRAALRSAEGLLVADYGYGSATPARVREALSGCRSIPVAVDSRERVGAFRGAWACTPNQEELERALDLAPISSEKEVEQAARELLLRTGTRAVLVTRGARGMCLVERRRRALHISAFGEGEVADVTGAGDTVIATFTLSILAGATFADAARLANVAAGLVVLKYGTATVTPAEMATAIREHGVP